MSAGPDQLKTTVAELASRRRSELVPVGNKFSYFTTVPLAEEDLRQYVNEPVAALSAAVADLLPKTGILLAPYLERANGKGGDAVCFEPPPETRRLHISRLELDGLSILAFGIKDVEVADYHYHLYAALAESVADLWPQEAQDRYYRALREELSAQVHGEVDERSWHLKQALLRRQANVRKETKLFREYARQSFEDTLTLYMHGTCCDIDVETGPRQMPSRYVRRRLELLMSLFPPPAGYAVLPEHLKSR